MRLSICMIVKDEEANLKRCLDSLLPLIHEPWCELVVLDTGSTDHTVMIAGQYTNTVYEQTFDPWDFSAARNLCSSHAEGEMILIVDADEALLPECIYELENVVMNPAFEKVSTGFFTIRNYATGDRTQYSEMIQPRLFRNDRKSQYTGSVHNRVRTEEPYLFRADIVFGHWGYLFQEDLELLEKKKARSLPLLEKEYADAPDDLHTVTHLVKTYFMMHENEKVKELGEHWMTLMRGIEYHHGYYAYLEVFTNLATTYSSEADEANMLRVIEEAERYTDRLIPLYYIAAVSYQATDRDKAAEYFQRIVEICTEPPSDYEWLMNSDRQRILPQSLHFLSCYYFGEGMYQLAGNCLNEGIRMNEAGLPLRWDVWNEEVGKNMLKSIETVTEELVEV